MVLASRVVAHTTYNRNLSMEAAIVVGAKERLTRSCWVLLYLLVPLALFYSLRYEISFIYKILPGCSVLSTHFPRLRLIVALCGASRACLRICFRSRVPQRTPALEGDSPAYELYAQTIEAGIP